MNVPSQKAVRILLGVLVVYIALGATFYHFVEKWNWVDSWYFAVITLSTVGYGDFSPQTNMGKLFTTGFIFVGVGLFVAVANLFLKSRGAKAVSKRRSKLSQ